jgi:hypothetical protein
MQQLWRLIKRHWARNERRATKSLSDEMRAAFTSGSSGSVWFSAWLKTASSLAIVLKDNHLLFIFIILQIGMGVAK